jgi:hypothetical protein
LQIISPDPPENVRSLIEGFNGGREVVVSVDPHRDLLVSKREREYMVRDLMVGGPSLALEVGGGESGEK